MGPGIAREDGNYSVEQVVCEDTGVAKGYCLNANHTVLCAYKVECAAEAIPWTKIIQADGGRFGAGIVLYKNALGGRVVTFAVSDPASLPQNYQRQTIIQNVIRFLLAEHTLPLVTGGAHLLPIYFKSGSRSSLVVLNAMPDPVEPLVHMEAAEISAAGAYVLSPLREPIAVDVTITSSHGQTTIACPRKLDYLGYFVLEW